MSMDEVVILWPHSVSEKGLLNCLDMKCGLDEGLEQKTSLYIKHSLSQSRRTFIRPGKLTSPTASVSTGNRFSESNFQDTGLEGGEVVEPESEHSTESKSKSFPSKAKFIRDMVDRFDWHEHCADDSVVCQKMNKVSQKGSVANRDEAELIKETDKSRGRTLEIVSSGRKLPASESFKPSPAPKPRKITKDKSLCRNNFDENTCTNRDVELTKHGSEKLYRDVASCGSCSDVSNSVKNSALSAKSMTSLSKSCGDLKQNESSDEFVDSSLSQRRSKESPADESAEEIVPNEDDSDESEDEWKEDILDSRLAIQQTRSLSPSAMSRHSSNSSTKTLVARDSLNRKVVRVPSCEDLDQAKQLKVEYVNETDSEKSKDLIGAMSLMNEGKTISLQNGSQTISDSFQASKSIKVRKMGVADSDEDMTSDPGDMYNPPGETVSIRQRCEVRSRFDAPLRENPRARTDSANEAEDTRNPEATRDISDPIRSLNLRQSAFHPPMPSPRASLPPGSPALNPRKASKGHLDAALLSQVVLPLSPASGSPHARSPAAPPALPPRVPTRQSMRSASSQSTPSPSVLPKRFTSMQALSHSRSRRAPLPPPPTTIAEVASTVQDDYCGDLDAGAPPSVPQRLSGRHTSHAADRIQSKMAHSRRQAATMVRGHEAQHVVVDSGNPTRHTLSSTSSQSMNDLRKKVGSRGSTLSLHVPAPGRYETGVGQVSPSRSEGYLRQSSDGYMPMGSQRSTSTSSQLSSPSDSINDVDDTDDTYMIQSAPLVPPRVATLKRRSPTLSYSASDADGDDLNRIIKRDNSYLDLQADEDYEKYSYLSLYDESEPLYQHYHQGAVVRQVLEQNIDEDDAECDSYYNPQDYIEHAKSRVDNILKRDSGGGDPHRKVVRGLSTLETAAKLGSGFRKLWCEMPKVRESGLLDHMTPEERRLQESSFEILSSEASYLKSLNLLVGHFMEMLAVDIDDKDKRVLSKQDFNWLFSNAKAVRSACIRMLEALEDVWQRGCVINALQLCSTITGVVQEHYGVYVTYCSNASYQERKMKELNERNPEFRYAVRRLEDFADCRLLPLSSFLALPMQRVTRMPLLVSAMCRYLKPDDAASPEVTRCIHVLQKIVKQCNEGARKMSNLEQMNKIDKILDFRAVKRIPLISQSRHLVKKGLLVHVIPEPSGFLKKSKRNLFFFLFNDLMVITKKKSDKQFEVLEYSPRSHIHAQVMSEETISKCLPYGIPGGCRNLFSMALIDKNVEFILSCESQSEQLRWIQAVTPVEQDTGDEVVYSDWDCPQVQAVMQYLATEPDELALEESDIVNVLRKINDGWYEGERIRDGERGWFPADHTVEIQNAHVRARNLRQQYQLMKNSSYGLSADV